MAPRCILYILANNKKCFPTLLRQPYMLEIYTLEMARLQCEVIKAKKSLSYISGLETLLSTWLKKSAK